HRVAAGHRPAPGGSAAGSCHGATPRRAERQPGRRRGRQRDAAPGRGSARPGGAARTGCGATLRPPGGECPRAAGRDSRSVTRAAGRGRIPDMPDVFDEVFALLTPDRLLHDPRATAEGVRVCILDSGAERTLMEDKFHRLGREIHPIEGGVFVAGRPEPLTYDGRQSTPHGTTVADIVLTLAPRVRLFSADIFGPQGSC